MTTAKLKDMYDHEVDLVRMQSDRQRNLLQAMKKTGMDALVLVDPANLQYAGDASVVAGGVKPAVVVVTADGKRQVFEAPEAPAPAPVVGDDEEVPALMAIAEGDTTMGDVADFLRAEGCQRIAVDEVDVDSLRALQWGFGHPRNGRIGGSGSAVAALARLVKTPDELECMRRSQQLAELSMEKVREVTRPGVRYDELTGTMAAFFADLDPDGEVLTTIFGPAATSPILIWHLASASPYNAAGEPPFPLLPFPGGQAADGDVIIGDTTLKYYGMECDWGRTWTIGDPSAHLVDQYHRWCDVRDRVVDTFKNGMTAADALKAATAGGERRPWLSHLYLIHGMGLLPAEYPMIGVDPECWYYENLVELGARPPWSSLSPEAKLWPTRDEECVFEPGMVLVLEPAIWDDEEGIGGYRSEDIYVVTESGEPEQISHASYAPFED
jgi:Xaa-Pro aminopeptidase